MKKIYRIIKIKNIIFLLFALNYAALSDQVLEKFNSSFAFNEIINLTKYSPRDAGTTNGHNAAIYIHDRLKSFSIDAKLQYFTDTTPEGKKNMVNVIGTIPGKIDNWIIIGSHFDTMPGIKNYIGANDSGSSTGILIELSRIFSDIDLNYGIKFVFFDGEEGIRNYIPGDGLHGSRYFSKYIKKSNFYKKCKAMILLDMVGDKDLTFTLPINTSPILSNMLFSSARKLDLENYIKPNNRLFIIDDHVPFQNIGIPSINIIDFNYGSKEGLNDFWHTDKDNLENISKNSLEISANLTIGLLKELNLY